MHLVHAPPDASEDEVAAALAAVACFVEEDAQPEQPARSAWSAAAALEAQGQPEARNAAYSTWGSVERARRAARWSKGIAGL